MPIKSILLIDDSDDFREITRLILSEAGYSVTEAQCPHDAFQFFYEQEFDLILCDLHMPFITGERQTEFQVSFNVGIMTIQELQDLYPTTPVVGITSVATSDLCKIRSILRNIPVVSKPTSKQEMLMLVAAHDVTLFPKTAHFAI